MSSRWAVAAIFLSSTVFAHAKGFHKRVVLTVEPRMVRALVTMDVDSGKRAEFLRRGADHDGDGSLSNQELAGLKGKLEGLVSRPLEVELSSFRVPLKMMESKLNVRGNQRVGDEGMSVALLFEAELPREVATGMTLKVRDSAPDQSHVRVEVFRGGGDAGVAVVSRDMKQGEEVTVRLE